jgi:hypothetical protein
MLEEIQFMIPSREEERVRVKGGLFFVQSICDDDDEIGKKVEICVLLVEIRM